MHPDEEIDDLSPETRERMERAGIEVVAMPLLWLECQACGCTWAPVTRRGGDVPGWVCPNGCNAGLLKR